MLVSLVRRVSVFKQNGNFIGIKILTVLHLDLGAVIRNSVESDIELNYDCMHTRKQADTPHPHPHPGVVYTDCVLLDTMA